MPIKCCCIGDIDVLDLIDVLDDFPNLGGAELDVNTYFLVGLFGLIVADFIFRVLDIFTGFDVIINYIVFAYIISMVIN
jgi:hypothetical protein